MMKSRNNEDKIGKVQIGISVSKLAFIGRKYFQYDQTTKQNQDNALMNSV